MTVRLVPEHLGELKLDVTSSGDVLSVRVASASAPVRQAIESQLHVLREALARDGFDQLRMTVTSSQNGSADGDTSHSGFGPYSRGSDFGSGQSQPDAAPLRNGQYPQETPEVDVPAPRRGSGFTEGSLDLFI